MASSVWTVALLSLAAGLAMAVGGLFAHVERIQPRWLESELRHGVVAFGGGALLAAVALVLVPEGMQALSTVAVAVLFAAGGSTFLGLDLLLARYNTPASQLLAMLSDFLPEAMALGAVFSDQHGSGPLLAFLIGLQNLPEGFASYREMVGGGGLSGGRILGVLVLLSLLGPAAGLTGFYLLANQPELVGGIMIFAAGGILYLIFQDIAPQAKLNRHWLPPLGAVAGFLLGIVAQRVLHSG